MASRSRKVLWGVGIAAALVAVPTVVFWPEISMILMFIQGRRHPDVSMSVALAQLLQPCGHIRDGGGHGSHPLNTKRDIGPGPFRRDCISFKVNVFEKGSSSTYQRSPESAPGPSVPGSPSNHTATRLYSGEVLVVVGGSSTFLYDPYNNQWRAGPPTQRAHADHTATLLYSGQVLIAGGSDGSTELYDPYANTWTLLPNIPATYTS